VNMIVDQLREDSDDLRELSLTTAMGGDRLRPQRHRASASIGRSRGGRSPANHPGILDFDLAVDELETIRPRVAIAHVRKCTISHCGFRSPSVPARGILFAHNGRMSDSLMVALLTADDPTTCSTSADYDSTYIDSELYFLYCSVWPPAPRGVARRRATPCVYELSMLTQTRLNFRPRSGDTLFVSATHRR